MRALVYGSNPRMESGMGKVGLELAKGLARAGHDVHYFSPNQVGPKMEYPTDAPAEETFTLYGQPNPGGPGVHMFKRRLAETNPDVVVSNRNWQSLDFLAGVLNDRYMNQGQPTPLVLYGPPIEAEHKPPVFERILLEDHLNEVYMVPYTEPRYVDMFHEWGLEDYLLPQSHDARYVPHGVDHSIFHPDATTAEPDAPGIRAGLGLGDRFIVSFVGENWRRKNLDILFNAWQVFRETLLDDGEQRPFLMLHTDPQASRGGDKFYAGWNLVQTAISYGLNIATAPHEVTDEADVVSTKRYVGAYEPRATVAGHFATADLMCLPTSGEGFSLTTLEAMACGCPVLQTDLPTLRWLSGAAAEYVDVIQDHAINSGERMATPSVADLAEQLIGLYHDPARRQGMAEQGVERSGEFSWTRMGGELATALEWVADAAE